MVHAREDYQDGSKKLTIKEDEPVFLLRAKDKYMPEMLRRYIELVSSNTNHDVKMIASVKKHIELVVKWQTENGCKEPDL